MTSITASLSRKLTAVSAAEITAACREWNSGVIDDELKLKGRGAVESTYVRYCPAAAENALRAGLEHDTRYIGGGPRTRGRTVVIFPADALRFVLERVGCCPRKYANLQTTAEIANRKMRAKAGRFSQTESDPTGEALRTSANRLYPTDFADNNTTWLIYADWLEERGDARSELIRNTLGG